MNRHHDIHSHERCPTRILGTLVILATTGCIRPNDEHCLFAGGDLSETDISMICVVPTSKDRETLTLDEHGWHDLGTDRTALRTLDEAVLPEGYLWVPFGLPRQFEGESLRSVQGLVEAALAAPPCERSYRELEKQWEPLAAYGTETLDKKTLLGLEEAALPLEDLKSLNSALLGLVVACNDVTPGTDTDASSGTGETDSETETDSMGSSSTTEPMSCMGNEDCPDAGAPFCGMTGECGTCDATEDADAACAGLDPMSPVCLGGACVQCTAKAPEACTGLTPVCDEESNLCVPCTAHDQCGDAACNLYTGACLPGDAVVHVGGMEPDFLTISNAVASFGEGAQGTIVVHEGEYNESATVSGGRVLAFLAAEDEPPVWVRNSGNTPQLTVNMGATVLLDGMLLSGNLSSMVPALVVTGADSQAWLDRSRIVQNAGGGIRAETMAQLTLRNCFVGQDATSRVAVMVATADARILYTTALGGFGMDTRALQCTGISTVDMRNSIFATLSGSPEIECTDATISFTAAESNPGGMGSSAIGDVDETIMGNLFVDFAGGDFHLSKPVGPREFATTARWTTGDPPSDIDGDPRPTNNDTPDYAGADIP